MFYRWNLTQKRLEECKSRLRRAQVVGRIGDWEYFPNNDCLFWSGYLREIYGKEGTTSSLGVIGTKISSDSYENVAAKIKQVFITGEPREYEILVRLADGRESWRSIHAVPQFDSNGKIISVFGTDQDITDKKNAELYQARFEERSRFELVNALASTLAHEISQPITAALNYVSLIKSHPKNAELGEYTKRIEENLDQAARLIKGSRQLMDEGRLSTEPISLSEITERSLPWVADQEQPSHISVTFQFPENADCVCANRIHLRHVFSNLLRNSFEATPSTRRPSAVVRSFRRGRNAVVCVIDNGSGFAAGIEPFTAFNTTKETGLGLGLSLSKTVIEGQDGKIWLHRTSHSGSEIRFTLPLAD